ncbi:MAG: hypothetical protein B6A08_13905 [Sorangiineae bacterium NIC37A_2]|nr:MAG: hypothetical protein B6A08_13905 [Sorangiineae bacterium NIC37A_2]
MTRGRLFMKTIRSKKSLSRACVKARSALRKLSYPPTAATGAGAPEAAGLAPAVLRRAVLRRAVLRRAVLRRAVLRRAVLRRAVLREGVARWERRSIWGRPVLSTSSPGTHA